MRLALIVCVTAGFACGKSEDKKAEPAGDVKTAPQSDPASEPKAEPESPPPPALIWHPISELDIQIEVPRPATHAPILTDVYGVQAPGCALEIGKEHRGDAVYDDVLASLTKNAAGNSVEAFAKKEKNDDGTFAIEASYKTKNGTRWIVERHIAVAGAAAPPLSCRQRAIRSAEHAACVSRACASVKAL